MFLEPNSAPHWPQPLVLLTAIDLTLFCDDYLCSYRLCPANATLTEECFQQHHLEFDREAQVRAESPSSLSERGRKRQT